MKKWSVFFMLIACCGMVVAASPGKDVLTDTSGGKPVRGRYAGTADIGMTGYDDLVMFRIQTVHGYRLNPCLFLGIGTGVGIGDLSYSEKDKRADPEPAECGSNTIVLSVPVFAHARLNFLPDDTRRFIPFATLNFGYNFFADNQLHPHGIMYEVALGYGYRAGRRFGVNVSAGYSSFGLGRKTVVKRADNFTFKFGFDW